MSHDLLCPISEGPCCSWMGDCECQCQCDWIKRVREDERAAALRDMQEGVLDGSLHGVFRSVRLRALSDAVEAVRLSPSADIELVERSQVITAIEALGGER